MTKAQNEQINLNVNMDQGLYSVLLLTNWILSNVCTNNKDPYWIMRKCRMNQT